MTWNVDLNSGGVNDRIVTSREGVEAETAEEAIQIATLGDVGHDWPITDGVAHEPGGCRYWDATPSTPEEESI